MDMFTISIQTTVLTVLACYSYILGVRRGKRIGSGYSFSSLKDLINHIHIHSNYSHCGYSHMTSEQKALFNAITGINNDSKQ